MIVELDEKGFPVDTSNWPETAKMKKITPTIELVVKIVGFLVYKGYIEKGKFYSMLDLEAEVFNEIGLFKEIDNHKLDLEMKEWKHV